MGPALKLGTSGFAAKDVGTSGLVAKDTGTSGLVAKDTGTLGVCGEGHRNVGGLRRFVSEHSSGLPRSTPG